MNVSDVCSCFYFRAAVVIALCALTEPPTLHLAPFESMLKYLQRPGCSCCSSVLSSQTDPVYSPLHPNSEQYALKPRPDSPLNVRTSVGARCHQTPSSTPPLHQQCRSNLMLDYSFHLIPILQMEFGRRPKTMSHSKGSMLCSPLVLWVTGGHVTTCCSEWL